MKAVGRDRIVKLEDGSFHLSSPFEKGWRARLEGTKTEAEHPGTAIECDDELFEVVALASLPNGVRYTLAPWNGAHTIRELDRYDEESEQRRNERRVAAQKRVHRANAITVGAIFAGLLPGHVQEELENEYGTAALRMSFLSALFFLTVGAAGVAAIVVSMRMGHEPPIRAFLLPVFHLFLFQSVLRMAIIVLGKRAIGSLEGSLAYLVYRLGGGKAVGGRKGESSLRRPAAAIVDPDEATKLRDRLRLAEPLIALLPESDQLRIESKYAIDLVPTIRFGAIALLLFALVGIRMSLPPFRGFSEFLSLVTASYLLVEQLVRIARVLTGRRTGSVLGFVARPFVARWLR
jgi:hypothetical protein